MSVVGAVLTHWRDEKTVVKGLTAQCDGLKEFGDFLGSILRGWEVIVGLRAREDRAGWRILNRIEPR
jgi:hypothetical protein